MGSVTFFSIIFLISSDIVFRAHLDSDILAKCQLNCAPFCYQTGAESKNANRANQENRIHPLKPCKHSRDIDSRSGCREGPCDDDGTGWGTNNPKTTLMNSDRGRWWSDRVGNCLICKCRPVGGGTWETQWGSPAVVLVLVPVPVPVVPMINEPQRPSVRFSDGAPSPSRPRRRSIPPAACVTPRPSPQRRHILKPCFFGVFYQVLNCNTGLYWVGRFFFTQISLGINKFNKVNS